jgi:TPP-dependent 2-oxoacid decarboxylase
MVNAAVLPVLARRYEAQMQYGSIGWSVGAALGCALGVKARGRRVLHFVGDGCFQIAAQARKMSPS